MTHKRAVVHMARDSAMQIKKFFPNDLPCDIDVTIAGAILCDVGKLLEYTKVCNLRSDRAVLYLDKEANG